jgi:M6 family metalloprotease-like protein
VKRNREAPTKEVYMNATKKFRMLLSVFIVLGLLLGTSLNPAHAQGPGKENAAAPGRRPIHLRQIAGEVSSLSGWFSIIWGDSKDGKSSMIYTLTDVNGRRTLLQMNEKVAKRLGGLLQFNGKYVSVQGTLATPSYTGATSDSTQSPPAVLNVISISLAPPPGSKAPTINDVTALAVVSGSRPWVTIMCKFSDIAAEPNNLAYFQGMYGDTQPGLNHYWKELSFNTADVAGSTTGTGWYTLPDTELHYNPTNTEKGTNLSELADDCIAAADATVDFSLYSGINMMFNSDFDNGWAWGGSRTMTLDNVTRSWSTTWEPPWSYANVSVIAHEMGHGFGLPHSSYNRAAVYDNAWDVMSQDRYNCAAATDPTYGCMAQHTISYHKDLLGWIPGARKIPIAGPVSATTLILEDLAAPASANYQIAIIPIGGSATNFYTVEARRFTGYDAKLPDEAVIIHNVDTTNGIPAVLVPGGLSSTNPSVRFTVGETFTDTTNDIAVIVRADTGTGFEVTISNGNLPPTSDAGGPYTQQCTGPTTTVALDGSGSSDPEGLPLTYSWSTNCPGGTFDNAALAKPKLTVNTSPGCGVGCTVSLTVTDNQGLSSVSDSATVTIQDTTPPVITCPGDRTIECSVSSAPSNTGTASATDNCIPVPSIGYLDSPSPGSCPQASTISRSWTATDGCTNKATCVQTIHIVDTTPPVIQNVVATPNVIWPPNHKMVQVAVTATATDNCDTAPHCDITSVNSNEPVNGLGDGDTAPDWIITGDLTVDLRAERSGIGNGRIYMITVTCTDACGNSSVGNTTVTVPHDQKKK